MNSTDERTVDAILDEGTCGLLYFEQYVPILRRIAPDAVWTYADLCARYDEQRGLDLALLTADAHLLTVQSAEARSAVSVHDRSADDLSASWFGEASDAASADVRSGAARGRVVAESIEDLARAMQEAAGSIRVAVSDKSSEIAAFDPGDVYGNDRSRIDGFGLAHVGAVDRLSVADPEESMTFVQADADICLLMDVLPAVVAPEPTEVLPHLPVPGLASAVSASPQTRIRHARDVCRQWLDTTFVPVVSAACRHLTEICTLTDAAVRELLSTVAAVAEAIEDQVFENQAFETDTVENESSPALEYDASVSTSVHPSASFGAETATGPTAPGESPGASPHTRSGHELVGREGSVRPASESPATAVPSTTSTTASTASGPQPTACADTRPGEKPTPGLVPGIEEIVGAFEKAGHNLTEGMRTVLDDAMARFADAGLEAPTDTPPDARPEALSVGHSDPVGTEPQSESTVPRQSAEPPAGSSPDSAKLPPSNSAAELGHVEVAVDGHAARVALSDDGVVSVEFSTPAGDSRYELRPGPFGLPVVVQVHEPPESAPAAAASTPATVESPPVESLPVESLPVESLPVETPPAESLQGEECVVSGSQPTPAIVDSDQEPLAPPVDAPVPASTRGKSGARLMEAGPL